MCSLSGRNDSRHACPPPIPLEQSRQNVPSSSHYISLKRNRPAVGGLNASKTNSNQKIDASARPIDAADETRNSFHTDEKLNGVSKVSTSELLCC